MNKQQFLEYLKKDLSILSSEEINEALSYYEEIIDDYVEDGKIEEDIIKELGKTKAIAKKIIEENDKKKKSNFKSKYSWTILMIVLSPFTISLIAIWFSLILTIYCGILTVFILGISSGILAIAYLIDFVINLTSNLPWAIFELGFGILSSGLLMLLICLSKKLFSMTNYLTKKSYTIIINFIRGENNEK